MTTSSVTPLSFGHEHFGQARLGDQRRTNSLIDLANRFHQHPGGSLPQKCKDPNALRRCYDLMDTATVTHAAVLQPHVQRALRLVLSQTGVVLLVHDTTELDYSSHTALHDQLGQIGNGFGRGYECHNSLAVLPGARTVLGLVHQALHVRADVPADETPAQRAARDSRESLLWLKGVNGVSEALRLCQRQEGLERLPEGLLLVDVADRGGDTFEFLDHEDRLGRPCLIRSKSDRRMRVGHDHKGRVRLLHTYLRSLPAQGHRPLTVAARDGRPERETEVSIAWAAVTVLPPEGHPGLYRKEPLLLWAIHVWEGTAPAEGEALEWFLLTNLPVNTVEQAWEKVDWYCVRWVVEEFHKAQKTGCAIEEPQFERVERLQPMIALLSVVAVSLLNLRELCRDEALAAGPASEVIDAESVEVLSAWRYEERRVLSVREFCLALGRLGGHQNRRGDGLPGWLVLWRGWQALQLMVAGVRAVRQLEAQAQSKDAAPPHSMRERDTDDSG